MVYELKTNSGDVIGVHHRYSGFIPINAASWLDGLKMSIGEAANIDGITYTRIK